MATSQPGVPEVVADTEALTEAPEVLTRLIRIVSRAFYSMEHGIVIDLLVHFPCIKEDDLLDLIKVDRKQLRALLHALRSDKVIKTRMRVETDDEGKINRHNYYFINYQVFVNVMKYKLDHIRRRIELEERDMTSRSSFKCPSCEKSYTDLEVGELLDPISGQLLCTFCKTEVVEDEAGRPKGEARLLLAKFNQQAEPLYNLIRQCEDLNLSSSVLEPEPVDVKAIQRGYRSKSSSSKRLAEDESRVWSGDLRRAEFGMMPTGDDADGLVTIRPDHGEAAAAGSSAAAGDRRDIPPAAKEQPIWMRESAIGVTPLSSQAGESGSREGATATTSAHDRTTTATATTAADDDDILQALIAHETASMASASSSVVVAKGDEAVSASARPSTDILNLSGDEMDSDDEDMDEVDTVTVAGETMSYHDVSEEMIGHMSDVEKQVYIEVGKRLYAHMYD